MANDVKIDIGGSLVWAEDFIRRLLHKDAASVELVEWFKSLHGTAVKQTSVVQCVGMADPVAFHKIYQPTRLLLTGTGDSFTKPSFAEEEEIAGRNKVAQSILAAKALEKQSITVRKFLERKEDAIIFAGPGWGKTTFLHYVFRLFMKSDVVLPVLITLRRTSGLDDLDHFLKMAGRITKDQHRDSTLLLVDGYDEIGVEERRRVSEALLRYQGLGIGKFCLTCRDYYDVFNLTIRELRIDHFTAKDKEQFVRAFLSAVKSKLDPVTVISDLEARGFSEFLAHPLLLTLACILKTSSSTAQPRSALRLLDRALEVLCYKWDEHKGISRHHVTGLDGKDRVQVLKRIAHNIKLPHIPYDRAIGIARTELDRMGFDDTDPRQVLTETAQFYGILARREDGWEFVHRTIHDFLGAKYWVETGEFAKATQYEWNARTAYAACLTADATDILKAALKADGLPTVTEILNDAPSFDMKQVIQAVIEYYSQPDRVVECEISSDHVFGRLQSDFVCRASTRFLSRLFEQCCKARGKVLDVIAAYCLLELTARCQPLEFLTYEAGLTAYKSDTFTFGARAMGYVRLGTLNPADKRPRLLRGRSKS